MFGRNHILDEIKRITEQNGGVPPGSQRFYTLTGIKQSDWRGVYWARWGDALTEAGFSPNKWGFTYQKDFLLEKLAELAREMGHLPTIAEIRLRTRRNAAFPSEGAYKKQFGSKTRWVLALLKWCQERTG